EDNRQPTRMREHDNDTISDVRSTRWGAVLIAVACSSDPTLHVTVDHAGVAVASTTVTVYESETLTCIDVAYGFLTVDQLAALAVAEETIDAQATTTG